MGVSLRERTQHVKESLVCEARAKSCAGLPSTCHYVLGTRLPSITVLISNQELTLRDKKLSCGTLLCIKCDTEMVSLSSKSAMIHNTPLYPCSDSKLQMRTAPCLITNRGIPTATILTFFTAPSYLNRPHPCYLRHSHSSKLPFRQPAYDCATIAGLPRCLFLKCSISARGSDCPSRPAFPTRHDRQAAQAED